MLFPGKRGIAGFLLILPVSVTGAGISTSTTSSYMPEFFSLAQSATFYTASYCYFSANVSTSAAGEEKLQLTGAGGSLSLSPDTRLSTGVNLNQSVPREGFYNTSVSFNASYTVLQNDSLSSQIGFVLNRSVSVQSFGAGNIGAGGKIGQYSAEANWSGTLWYRTTISSDFSAFWYDINPGAVSQAYLALFQRSAVTGRFVPGLMTLQSTAAAAQKYSAGISLAHQLSEHLSFTFGMNLNALWLREGVSTGQNASLSLNIGTWSFTYGIVRNASTVFVREKEFIKTDSVMHSLTVGTQW